MFLLWYILKVIPIPLLCAIHIYQTTLMINIILFYIYFGLHWKKYLEHLPTLNKLELTREYEQLSYLLLILTVVFYLTKQMTNLQHYRPIEKNI